MKSPSFQFYVRDWISSRNVRDMTGEEVKAYMFLLCESWLEVPRATLPNDIKKLSKMAQMDSADFMKSWESIMSLNFVLDEKINRYYNPKLKKLSHDQQNHYENGKKGGNPNLKNGKSNPYLNQKDNRGVNLNVNREDIPY